MSIQNILYFNSLIKTMIKTDTIKFVSRLYCFGNLQMFTFSFNFKQTHELLFNQWILFLSHNAPPTLIVSLILLPGFVSPLDFNPECFPPSPVPLRRQPSFHSLPKLIWTLWSNRIRCLSKRLLLQARTYLVRAFINPGLIDYH